MAHERVDKRLDLRGETCPYTLLRLKDALKEMAAGQVLEVQLDDGFSVKSTVPAFCRRLNYPLEVWEAGDGEWRLAIQKAEAGQPR